MENITSREQETYRPFPTPEVYECTICLNTSNLRLQGLTGQLICVDKQACEARFARWEARQ